MSKIKFIEDTHRYLTEDERELISVSAFTKKFQKVVDWRAKAKKTAKKSTENGVPMTTQQMLDKWDRKRDESARIGTILHKIKEDELNEQSNPIFYNVPCENKQCTFSEGVKWSIPVNELKNNTVYPELMIYDEEFMVCGQSDKVIVANNKINIYDYKSDYEIKFVGWSNKFVSPQKLLKPLQYIDDCNGNLYSIKMSLYMYMLWKANKGKFLPGELIIEHVHLKRDPDNDNIPILKDGKPIVLKIEKITLPYRKKEVMEMLQTIK